MNPEENEKISTYGSRSYYVQILQDLAQEPHEICNIDKRRKCDSYYIQLYNKLKGHYIKLLKEYSDCKEICNQKENAVFSRECTNELRNEYYQIMIDINHLLYS